MGNFGRHCLRVGADLSKLSDATLATLTNPAVLAIDQDLLGLQAVKVHEEPGGLEVWSKRLARPENGLFWC